MSRTYCVEPEALAKVLHDSFICPIRSSRHPAGSIGSDDVCPRYERLVGMAPKWLEAAHNLSKEDMRSEIVPGQVGLIEMLANADLG